MSKNQYNAPVMEVVEFGKEDAVCTASSPVPPPSRRVRSPRVTKIVCVSLATRASNPEERRHAW